MWGISLLIFLFLGGVFSAWMGLEFFQANRLAAFFSSLWSTFILKWTSRKVQHQWPDAVLFLSGALQSGLNLGEALCLLATESPDPLRSYLCRLLRQVEGSPLHQQVQVLFQGPDLVLPRAVLLASLKSGGRAATLLRKSATILRQKMEFQEKVKSLTAQVRLTAWVAGVSPFAFLFLLAYFSPEMMTPLFSTPSGWILLGLLVLLITTGLCLVHRMARIEP